MFKAYFFSWPLSFFCCPQIILSMSLRPNSSYRFSNTPSKANSNVKLIKLTIRIYFNRIIMSWCLLFKLQQYAEFWYSKLVYNYVWMYHGKWNWGLTKLIVIIYYLYGANSHMNMIKCAKCKQNQTKVTVNNSSKMC